MILNGLESLLKMAALVWSDLGRGKRIKGRRRGSREARMGLLVCLETNKFVSGNLKRLGRQLTQSSEEPGDPMPIPTSFVLNAPIWTEPPTLPSSPTPRPTTSLLAASESSRNRAKRLVLILCGPPTYRTRPATRVGRLS